MKKKDNSHKRFKPFSYKNLDELKKEVKRLNLDLTFDTEVDILKKPIKTLYLNIPNRLSIQPMEGFDATLNGSPGELTMRRYLRYANSGAGLIWVEATAVSENGKSNPHQLSLREENITEFNKFVSLIRGNCNKTLKSLGFNEECILILQLNHSGRYSKKENKMHPIRAFNNPHLDNASDDSERAGHIISDDELKVLESQWVGKVQLAKNAGFDGVDIKACHGYLVWDLLEARTRENSSYGGESLKNRAKFLLNIIKKSTRLIKSSDKFFLTTRIGAYDGITYPYGFGVVEEESKEFPAPMDLSEPLKLINLLYENGVRLINLTAGNPHYKPQLTRPFDAPIKGKRLPDEHPLVSINRIVKMTSEIKNIIPEDLIVIGSGYSYLRQFGGFLAAAMIREKKVDISGFGRMAFANPKFPKQLFKDGRLDKNKVCITCSQCSQLMREGKNTGCVIRDPQYKRNEK
ncbi:MAG: flavin oxidoreductase/NADH oxidase [Candidatus Lokiarchaeota archaeon]|nr:flavin oxidoreductase/NADH oxidase [Candidatus Lokiarchaeota archaeon]MBD3337624.1 flavin oxidoreductase/NADH oxidase [Candidatus Lokiarchaeota archaeon]